jgi:DNA adenine methylase
MPRAVFPFRGGKGHLASWITDNIPEHTCYVEVFGGAAGVLFNKPRSDVEIYNDRDRDLVQFFEVLHDRREELVEWLDAVPYSRDIHDDWAGAFYNGYRPTDDIERAGQFFYLRYSQWGSSYDAPSGFATSKVQDQSQAYKNKLDRLEEFANRLKGVTIEAFDWTELIEKYDSDETVFYCHLPYPSTQDYYPVSGIDHERLVETLTEIEGSALFSADEVVEGLGKIYVEARDAKFYIDDGVRGEAKDVEQLLAMNFDPESAE